MTLEQKLIHDCGLTDNPTHGLWLLQDGTLINGSHEGYQRDIDHHEIQQYFKKSKLDTGSDSYLYMQKFMRRGNIRWGCSETGLALEFIKTPTEQQFKTILKYARTMPQSAFKHNGKWQNIDWFLKYAQMVSTKRNSETFHYIQLITNERT